ncbi:MAG TPA: biotin transporter BioY [Actinomycetota bacterium]|nr:biotin transporter BioY [Actinomycetota bacterium]
MTTIAESIGRRDTRAAALATDALLVLTGSLFVAGLAQLYVKLPFTPVPVTGQTLAVLLVGGALGALRGGSALLLYVAWIAIGLPFGAEGKGGDELLRAASATGGYLWGFIIAAALVGWLAERGWDRKLSSAIGAMLLGSVVIYLFGVPWLASALNIPVVAEGDAFNDALEFGMYPFVVGDLLKLLIAAAALPAAWRLLPKE